MTNEKLDLKIMHDNCAFNIWTLLILLWTMVVLGKIQLLFTCVGIHPVHRRSSSHSKFKKSAQRLEDWINYKT